MMNTTDDLRQALADDDGSLPERWNPEDEAGATLVGTLRGVETIATRLGEAQIAVIEDAEDGRQWGVMLGRTVLRKRWELLNPQPGDTIGLKYVGWAEPRSKDQQGYHNYVLRVLRGGPLAPPVSAMSPIPADTGDDDDLPF
jgi:hypothetical protein